MSAYYPKILKNKAKDFMQNHETNPVARTNKIKSFLKNSTDPKLNERQVDAGVQKIDDAIQHLAYQRLV